MNTELTNSQTATSTSGASLASGRPLKDAESELVAALLDMFPGGPALKPSLATALVQDMADGGMGSLLFTPGYADRHAHQVVAAQAVDEDGVPLEISLNLDQNGALYELDIWKVDFSPLHRLPSPSELRTT